MSTGPPAAPSVVTNGGRWPQFWADGMAGLLTALVFYAEYASLGSYLGEQLPGAASAAQGALSVLGAVILAALLSIAQKRSILAGPRAASLAVLVGGIAIALRANADPIRAQDVAAVALSGMLIVAGLMQMLGRTRWVRTGIGALPTPIRKGFMFATAIAIVTGLSSRQLNACLQFDPIPTVAIVASSLAIYFLWISWCQKKGESRRSLLPLGVPIAAATSTIGYYTSMGVAARGIDRCGTLGTGGLDWSQLMTTPRLLDGAIARANLSSTTLVVLLGFGIALGIVLLLESLTTLADSEARVSPDEWPRILTISALVNVLSAFAGFSCNSLSTSRTNALVEANGRTSASALVHGIALLAILVLLVEWIGKLPQLTIAVVLIIVATQMIDQVLRQEIWSRGFASDALPRSRLQTWQFIGLVMTSVLFGLVMTLFKKPFGTGAVIALVAVIALQGGTWMLSRLSSRNST